MYISITVVTIPHNHDDPNSRDPPLDHDCVAADQETHVFGDHFQYELETPPFS